VERGRGWFRAETAIIVSHSSVVAAGTARCGETRSPAGPAVPPVALQQETVPSTADDRQQSLWPHPNRLVIARPEPASAGKHDPRISNNQSRPTQLKSG
jgi:hypothetical protein